MKQYNFIEESFKFTNGYKISNKLLRKIKVQGKKDLEPNLKKAARKAKDLKFSGDKIAFNKSKIKKILKKGNSATSTEKHIAISRNLDNKWELEKAKELSKHLKNGNLEEYV